MLPICKGIINGIEDNMVFCSIDMSCCGFGMQDYCFDFEDLRFNPNFDGAISDAMENEFFPDEPFAPLIGRLIEFHVHFHDQQFEILNQTFRVLPLVNNSFCIDCKKRIMYLLENLQAEV